MTKEAQEAFYDYQVGEQYANVWDIQAALRTVEPGSLDEYLLCWDVATQPDRSDVSARDRYFYATMGTELHTRREVLVEHYDELEASLQRNVSRPVVVQKTPNLVLVGRLASPTVRYQTVGGRDDAHGFALVEVAASSRVYLGKDGAINPNASDDIIEWDTTLQAFDWRTTDAIWSPTDDPRIKRFDHCEHVLEAGSCAYIGPGQIQQWLESDPRWAEHYDNVLGAYRTGGINIPVAKQKGFNGSLHRVDPRFL